MNKVWKRKKKWTRGRTEPGQYMAEWEKYFDDLRDGKVQGISIEDRPLMEIMQEYVDNMQAGLWRMNEKIRAQNETVLHNALKNVDFQNG